MWKFFRFKYHRRKYFSFCYNKSDWRSSNKPRVFLLSVGKAGDITEGAVITDYSEELPKKGSDTRILSHVHTGSAIKRCKTIFHFELFYHAKSHLKDNLEKTRPAHF